MSDQFELDWCKARVNRDNGIRVAAFHADAKVIEWNETALYWLKKYLAFFPGNFQAEDVRHHAEQNGFPSPPTARAWGGVMVRAKISGLIEKVGYEETNNPSAHRALAGVWKKKGVS